MSTLYHLNTDNLQHGIKFVAAKYEIGDYVRVRIGNGLPSFIGVIVAMQMRGSTPFYRCRDETVWVSQSQIRRA